MEFFCLDLFKFFEHSLKAEDQQHSGPGVNSRGVQASPTEAAPHPPLSERLLEQTRAPRRPQAAEMQRSALAGPASRTFGDAEGQPGPVLRGVQFAPLGAGATPWRRDASPHQAHLGGFVPQQIVVQQAEGPPPLLNAGAAPARTQDLFLQSMPAEPSPQIQIEAEQELSRFKEHMKQIHAQLEQAVTETLQKIKAAGEANPVHVVVNEVPVEVTKVVRDEVEKLVETVKYVDRHVEVCSEFAVFGTATEERVVPHMQ